MSRVHRFPCFPIASGAGAATPSKFGIFGGGLAGAAGPESGCRWACVEAVQRQTGGHGGQCAAGARDLRVIAAALTCRSLSPGGRNRPIVGACASGRLRKQATPANLSSPFSRPPYAPYAHRHRSRHSQTQPGSPPRPASSADAQPIEPSFTMSAGSSSGQRSPSTTSSSDQTRTAEQPVAVSADKSGFSADHGHITRTVSHKGVPIEYFAGDGELQRQVSRQDSRWSTHTQDPNADDFDFEKQLRHLLRKADKEGVKRRECGGESSTPGSPIAERFQVTDHRTLRLQSPSRI